MVWVWVLKISIYFSGDLTDFICAYSPVTWLILFVPNIEESRDWVFNFEGVFCWYLGDSLILPNIYELLGIVLYCGELIITLVSVELE